MPFRGRPDGWTSPYESGHRDPEICAMIDCLSDWFHAIENGTAHLRLPDPSYQRRGGRPAWTEEELATLIETADAQVARELSWASQNKQMLCDAGPGFSRLALPQRLAFAQQLDSIKAEYPLSNL